MKYVKFMPSNDISSASRNKRELNAAHEYGYDCYCYCDYTNKDKNETFDDFTVVAAKHNRPSREMKKIKRVFLIIRNVFIHMSELKDIKPDIVSCHNIYGLAVAYFAYLFKSKKNKPKFIYDSHEFELRKKKRNKLAFWFIKTLEGFLIKRCAFSIMINEGIADGVEKIHNYNYNRIIVRSTPDYWNIDSNISKEMHDEFCEKLSAASDSFIVLYHGMFSRFRGIEELYKAMTLNNNFYTVMVGEPSNRSYAKVLSKLEDEYGIKDRILKYPLQTQENLWKYVSAADCGIVMNNTDNPNYIYALPNKFFENIQSLTPIICTNSIEMKRIVDEYDIGILSPSGDAEKLVENIELMKNDKELYQKFKENLVRAKNELCWENEKKKFTLAYDKYL